MYPMTVFSAGNSAAVQYAAKYLQKLGYSLCEEITKSPCAVLLDIPSFSPGSSPQTITKTNELFHILHPDSIVFGGNLTELSSSPLKLVDLLKEENYLRENAKITAYCALSVAAQALTVTPDQANTLIIGWGRIGSVLAQLLRAINVPVTVAARNPLHLQMLSSLGYSAAPLEQLSVDSFRLIINTVPYPVLDRTSLSGNDNTVMIDLASSPGLGHPDVIHARGLPGIHAPESSGKLIGKTVKRYLEEMIQ